MFGPRSQLDAFFHRRKCQRSLFLDLSVDYFVFPSKWCTPLVPCFLFIFVSIIYFRHTLWLLSLIFFFAQRFIPPLFFWNSNYWWASLMCKSVRDWVLHLPSATDPKLIGLRCRLFSRLATNDFSHITFPRNFALGSPFRPRMSAQLRLIMHLSATKALLFSNS